VFGPPPSGGERDHELVFGSPPSAGEFPGTKLLGVDALLAHDAAIGDPEHAAGVTGAAAEALMDETPARRASCSSTISTCEMLLPNSD